VTLRIARIRAVIGGIFALLGLGIGVEILLRPGDKRMGLAFAAVLIALGVVRVRMYLKMQAGQPP
jgi:hypothetical protein